MLNTFPSFKQMVHVIGKYDRFYDHASSYELKKIILQKEVAATREYVQTYTKKRPT